MNTYVVSAKTMDRKWFVVDAEGVTLGRLASQVAAVLMGKNKPVFTPGVDTGDFVIVINSDKVVLTGKKLLQKKYYHHSGFAGGLSEITSQDLLKKDSTQVIEHAVRGMLPKNSLGRKSIKKLKVFVGAEHPHAAQKPETLYLK